MHSTTMTKHLQSASRPTNQQTNNSHTISTPPPIQPSSANLPTPPTCQTCLALSNSGRFVASGQHGENADAIVWDYESKRLLYRMSEHDHGIQVCACEYMGLGYGVCACACVYAGGSLRACVTQCVCACVCEGNRRAPPPTHTPSTVHRPPCTHHHYHPATPIPQCLAFSDDELLLCTVGVVDDNKVSYSFVPTHQPIKPLSNKLTTY